MKECMGCTERCLGCHSTCVDYDERRRLTEYKRLEEARRIMVPFSDYRKDDINKRMRREKSQGVCHRGGIR